MTIDTNAWCWSVAQLPAVKLAGAVLFVLLCLASHTVAQNENSDDPTITREEWRARVDAAKARVQQMRREGEPFVPRVDDDPLRRLLQDSTLVYGDIVVTERGLFEFIGATAGPHDREEFRQIDRDKVLLPR